MISIWYMNIYGDTSTIRHHHYRVTPPRPLTLPPATTMPGENMISNIKKLKLYRRYIAWFHQKMVVEPKIMRKNGDVAGKKTLSNTVLQTQRTINSGDCFTKSWFLRGQFLWIKSKGEMIGVKLCDPYWCAETNPQLSSFWKNMFVRQISLFLSWQLILCKNENTDILVSNLINCNTCDLLGLLQIGIDRLMVLFHAVQSLFTIRRMDY